MAYDEIPKTVAAESSGQGLYELLKNLENKLITHRASVKVDNNASVPGTASGLFVFLQDGVGVRFACNTNAGFSNAFIATVQDEEGDDTDTLDTFGVTHDADPAANLGAVQVRVEDGELRANMTFIGNTAYAYVPSGAGRLLAVANDASGGANLNFDDAAASDDDKLVANMTPAADVYVLTDADSAAQFSTVA